MKIEATRVLDFDIECRPLSWYGGDWVTKEVTAIAWRFLDSQRPTESVCLGELTERALLLSFVEVYDQADLVTGHFIRGFDLPVLNGALMEQDLPVLSPKLTQDTKLDLVKRSGMSNSMENLGAEFGFFEKVKMTSADWREANRLTSEGIAKTRERVVSDVDLHIKLRHELLKRNLLRGPSRWTPTGSGQGKYHA